MLLPDSFLEELRARTPLAALVSRRVKLSRSGRQQKGCCPFHNEKTPSFYVYEDGYHCFGCGAHGDAISFVMQSQGASFMEAVQALAGEAGLELPKASPSVEAAERQRLDLHGILEAAQAVYQRRLHARSGRDALAYLRGRGLSDETITRFGLGWSGEGRGLAGEFSDTSPAQLMEAGLLRANEDGSPGRELFFNRVMFPIRDRRGRVISFGGRILGDGQPKYVNGPETPLFSKRRTLYGLDLAREAARAGGQVVAVEGYFDVIALYQAGIATAVASLGTALTTEHLQELWRLSPAPVLCFDGDAAGTRAAAHAVSTALPCLMPDRSIKVVTMPPGEDPDTLIRRRGSAAMTAALDAAPPLEDALFAMLREDAGAGPGQRAAFRARLEAAAASIRDRNLAREYRAALLDRFFAKSGHRAAQRRPAGAPRPAPDARMPGEREMVATLLHHPALLPTVEEAWCSVPMPPPLDRLRAAVIAYSDRADVPDGAEQIAHLRSIGLSTEVDLALAGAPSCALPTALPDEAAAGWWHFHGLMHRSGIEDAVREAHALYQAAPDGQSLERLNKLCIARERMRCGERDAEVAP